MTNIATISEMTASTIKTLAGKKVSHAELVEAARTAVIRYAIGQHDYWMSMSDAADHNTQNPAEVSKKGEEFFAKAWSWFSFAEDIKALTPDAFQKWHDAQAEADDRAAAKETAEVEAEIAARKAKRIRYGQSAAQPKINWFNTARA